MHKTGPSSAEKAPNSSRENPVFPPPLPSLASPHPSSQPFPKAHPTRSDSPQPIGMFVSSIPLIVMHPCVAPALALRWPSSLPCTAQATEHRVRAVTTLARGGILYLMSPRVKKTLLLSYELQRIVVYSNVWWEELSQTKMSDNISAASHEGWALERWEGQQRAECRKTCGRGAKQTKIMGMGYSTPRLDLWQGYSSCRNNGRFLTCHVTVHRVSTGHQGLSCPHHRRADVHHSIRWNVRLCQTAHLQPAKNCWPCWAE